MDATYLQMLPALSPEGSKSIQVDLVSTFVTSLSDDCNSAFMEVHLKCGRMKEAIQALKDCRAAVEALLAYAYWAIYRRSGLVFPKDFLRTTLDPHPHYDRHAVRFTFW